LWENGTAVANIRILSPGVYTVLITDANGCTGTASVVIGSRPRPPRRFSIFVLTSSDPNDISGPAGYGKSKWISVNDALPYRIRFENDPKQATAAANKVVIYHPVDKMADMKSFRLGSFSFRGLSFYPPENSSHYSKRLDLVDSLDVFIDVTAGLDVTQKRAFWIFQAIDPISGLPNIDPSKGFILINDTLTHMGEGEVNFTIKPLTTSKTGDTIKAYADIIFDINNPLRTNIEWNTIDAKPPVSKIRSIKSVGTDVLELAWNGSDDTKGSGIADYKLFVSSNKEPYSEYASTSDTSFIFKLTGGNEYRFQTIAADNTNNAEKIKTNPDTVLYLKPTVALGNDFALCVNDSIELSAGYGFDSYLWNNGSTNSTLMVKSAGEYFVKAIKDTIVSSDTIYITSSPLPQPSLHINPNEFCEGSLLSLNAGNGYKNYIWNTEEKTQSIQINNHGKFYVTVTDNNGCQGADSINITMNRKPFVTLGNDTIIEEEDTIVLVPKPNMFSSWRWNNNSINDSLRIISKKDSTGLFTYWVKVTDNKGCTNSDTVIVKVIPATGIDIIEQGQIKVSLYPNPTVDKLNLKIESPAFDDIKLELLSIEGLTIKVKDYKNPKNVITDQLDMSKMAVGPYILKITYKNSEIIRTIIKQ
jgi:hypothetical protein